MQSSRTQRVHFFKTQKVHSCGQACFQNVQSSQGVHYLKQTCFQTINTLPERWLTFVRTVDSEKHHNKVFDSVGAFRVGGCMYSWFRVSFALV